MFSRVCGASCETSYSAAWYSFACFKEVLCIESSLNEGVKRLVHINPLSSPWTQLQTEWDVVRKQSQNTSMLSLHASLSDLKATWSPVRINGSKPYTHASPHMNSEVDAKRLQKI